jgi:glycosyltransferase involved in cell wall biosynthesis
MKLSVIVPCYNVADYVDAAIMSVLHQTFRELEVIAVNDGSTDKTLEILRSIEQRGDPRLKVIDRPNGGLASARNAGIREAQGYYLGFLDGDDFWLPEKAARQIAVMDADPGIGISYTGILMVGQNLGVHIPRFFERSPTLRDMVGMNQMTASSVIARRSCFEVGLFNESLEGAGCEDWEMWCRIMHDSTLRASLIGDVLTGYRVRTSSMSFRFDNFLRSGDSAIKSLKRIIPNIPQRVFREGRAAQFRHAAWLSALSGARWLAFRYLINSAWYFFPGMRFRCLSGIVGVLVAIVFPVSIVCRIQKIRGKTCIIPLRG